MLRCHAVAALVVLAALVSACSQQPSCPEEPDASSGVQPPAHRLGWAPPGATAQNFTALGQVSGAVKGSPATLLQMYVVNRNTSARYLQLFDSSSAIDGGPLSDAGLPLTDAAATYQYLVPASTAVTVPLLPGGQSFVTGLSYGVSTAPGYYTAATAADHDVEAVYQ